MFRSTAFIHRHTFIMVAIGVWFFFFTFSPVDFNVTWQHQPDRLFFFYTISFLPRGFRYFRLDFVDIRDPGSFESVQSTAES